MPNVYATAEELETHLGSDEFLVITDRDADSNADSDAVADALAEASSLIDGFIARKLPAGGSLSVVPTWLKTVAMNLAVYELVPVPSQNDKDKRDEGLRLLRDVAAGKLALGVVLSAAQTKDDIVYEGPDFVMTREGLAGIL